MVKHTLIWNRALQTSQVVIGVLLEHFCAIGAAAEIHVFPSDIQLGGPLQWLFSQAGWAHDQLARFVEVFRGISDKEFNTPLATEVVGLTIMAMNSRLILANSKPYQRTAACGADQSSHFTNLLSSKVLPPIGQPPITLNLNSW